MAELLNRTFSSMISSYSPPHLIKTTSSASFKTSLPPICPRSVTSPSWLPTPLRVGIASSPGDDSVRDGRKVISQALAEVQGQAVPAPDATVSMWWERDFGATLKDVHSIEELEELVSNSQGKLVVVEFFATWCGSCRALYPKLCKLAAEHTDVIFAKVNCDENRQFCKSLNINVLPYFHLYQGALEQIDSFSCSISKLQKLKDSITKYTGASCNNGNTNLED